MQPVTRVLSARRPLLLLSLCSALLLALPASADERYISVSGEGQVSAWPDYLSIRLQISATERNASAAKARVDQSMNALLALSRDLNVAEKDIEAARITNQPVYEWVNNQRQLRGEQVSRQVTLTLRDLEQYTALVHQLLQLDAVQIQHSQPGFNDPAALVLKASTLALTQARQKATDMAAVLGNRLGKVLSIEEQGHTPAPMMAEMRMLSAKADHAPAPMLVQQEQVRASVQVRFELR